MLFILLAVLLLALGFLIWGWNEVDLRDAQGRLLNRKVKIKSADEGVLVGLSYGTYKFEVWHRGLFHWKPQRVRTLELEHSKISENEWNIKTRLSEKFRQPSLESAAIKTVLDACHGSYFKIFNSIYLLRNSLNDTTRIATLLLHPTGIYLFETVSRSGWIFGDVGEKLWSETNMEEDRMQGESFENPVLHSCRNVEALRRLFEDFNGLPLHAFFYVVFDDNAVLKQIPESTTERKIVLLSQLQQSLERTLHLAKTVYSEYEIDKLYRELVTYSDDALLN